MNFRVYQNERLLLGQHPRGGWRFSVLLVFRLSEDNAFEWVTVPWLGAAGSFVDRRGKECPPEERPRHLAHQAIRAEVEKRFGSEAAASYAQTSSWAGDTVSFVEFPAPATVQQQTHPNSQLRMNAVAGAGVSSSSPT